MFRKLSLLFVITALLLSLIVPVMAEDFGDFILPRDENGVLAQSMDMVGSDTLVGNSTNCVALQSNGGDSLIYGLWILGDATGTDWVKITRSTHTAGVTLANSDLFCVSNISTSIKWADGLIFPIRVEDAYIVANDTNTNYGVMYK